MLPPVAPVVVIHEDPGGEVRAFAARVAAYRRHHVVVRVAGECASACTMVLALRRVCAEPGASFLFHQAYNLDPARPDDDTERSDEGTAELLAHYPAGIRAWIAARGGLRHDFITLRGAAMGRLVPACQRGIRALGGRA